MLGEYRWTQQLLRSMNLTLNTRLLKNCLAGVDDQAAQMRINERTNHIAFIVCHLLDARCFLAGYLGVTAENPFKELLEGARGIDDMKEFPSLEQIVLAWQSVAEVLENRFTSITSAELKAQSSQAFPVEDQTVLSGIAFLLQHESFHIGQLALLRKHFGFGSMSYARE